MTVFRTSAAALIAALTLSSACGGHSYKSREELLDPTTCKECHDDHYADWAGSMHAYASDDPVFRAMNARGQRETGGELGSFCVKCHAPMALAEGATTDGLNLDEVPDQLKGVTCFFCHTVDEVQGDHNNPLHLADDLTMRGRYDDAVDNDAHRSAYSDLHNGDKKASATLCGSCHDIVVNDHAHIERTFAEWQGSVFSTDLGASCDQCHMDKSLHPQPIADAPGVFAREFHSHKFPGIDQALTPFPHADQQKAAIQKLLNTTVQSALCVVTVGQQSAVRVVFDAVGAGHNFPSGSAQDRRVWAEVTAYQGDQVMYQSGHIPDGQAVTDSDDPDLWLMRDCMTDKDGAPVDMFWQADDSESNALPAQLTFDAQDPRFYQSHIVQSYPHTPSDLLSFVPDKVTVQLHVRPMGLDVLGDLVQSGDLDQSIADKMVTYSQDLGDGPTLTWTPDTLTDGEEYLDSTLNQPARCVTNVEPPLNLSTLVPATDHTVCGP